MIEVKNMAAQGDVLFRKIEQSKLPKGLVEKEKGGRVIVAHSETGHHHAIDDGVRVFDFEKPDPLVCYLRMDADFADVVHHRPYDTHETLRLTGKPGDIWECRRQREHTPEGWRRVMD